MKRRRIFGLGGVLTLILASCASVPAESKAPDWIFTTPKPDATNTYFVGSASDPGRRRAAATNDAAANLMSSITQYIGVKLNVATTAEAKATLDSYSANIKSTVTSSSQNQVSGFSVKERFVQTDKKTKRVTVYVLAAYATADLEKEKARIADINKRAVDAVAVPEREGNASSREPRRTRPSANTSRPRSPPRARRSTTPTIKLEPRHQRGAHAPSPSSASTPRPPRATRASSGRTSPSPSRPSWCSGEGALAPGVPGAVVLLSYQRKSGTRIVSKTESVMTDASGSISFTPPPPISWARPSSA